jgi:isocitrate dehydrogenase (NAD+)
MDIANPSAMILAGALMLDYIGEEKAGEKIREAVGAVIREGKTLTKDLSPDRYVGTGEFTEAILEKIEHGND